MRKKENFDKFTKKVMLEVGLETPSSNFVKQVMRSVEQAQKQREVFKYKPIISNFNWLVIGVLLTALSMYLVLNSSTEIVSRYSYLYENYLDKVGSFYYVFNDVSFSPITMISFLIFVGYVLVQLMFLKNFFSKRLIRE